MSAPGGVRFHPVWWPDFLERPYVVLGDDGTVLGFVGRSIRSRHWTAMDRADMSQVGCWHPTRAAAAAELRFLVAVGW